MVRFIHTHQHMKTKKKRLRINWNTLKKYIPQIEDNANNNIDVQIFYLNGTIITAKDSTAIHQVNSKSKMTFSLADYFYSYQSNIALATKSCIPKCLLHPRKCKRSFWYK